LTEQTSSQFRQPVHFSGSTIIIFLPIVHSSFQKGRP
jgi:hypothetical protein